MITVYYNNVEHKVYEFFDIDFNRLRRDDDLPAVIFSDGSQHWYKNGKKHRDSVGPDGKDLPAIIGASGSQEWYKNGLLHRDGDLPAIIGTDGSQYWYKNGLLHRDGDLHACIGTGGSQYWYKNGLCHRDSLIGADGISYDLPAEICASGTQWWYKNGVRQKDGYNVNKNFNLYTFLFLQLFFRVIYIFRYNKQIWSPKNIAGIHTKIDLYKMLQI